MDGPWFDSAMPPHLGCTYCAPSILSLSALSRSPSFALCCGLQRVIPRHSPRVVLPGVAISSSLVAHSPAAALVVRSSFQFQASSSSHSGLVTVIRDSPPGRAQTAFPSVLRGEVVRIGVCRRARTVRSVQASLAPPSRAEHRGFTCAIKQASFSTDPSMASSEYYYNAPMARPPPPSPWMPLFFIGVLGSMWALPMWLRFEPLLTHAVNQLSILVSLAVPILLLFLLQWLAAPATYAGQLQYPNSRFYSNRGYNRYHTGGAATLSFFGGADPQSFGWALFLVLVLFLLVNSSAGR